MPDAPFGPMTEFIVDILRKNCAKDEDAEAKVRKSNVLTKYEGLRKEVTGEAGVKRFDAMLGSLKTVFIDQKKEVEGDNIAGNITLMRHFFKDLAADVENGRFKGNGSAKHLYDKYVSPQTARYKIEKLTEMPGRDQRPNTSTPADPVSEKFQLTAREALFKKKKRNTKQDTKAINTFVKSFVSLDAAVWKQIQAIARDNSLSPTQCTEALIDSVIHDDDSPWREFYQQMGNYKAMYDELQETTASLAELTTEVITLRETNILNQAFLTGDLAQGLVDEIAELKDAEQKERFKVKEAMVMLEKLEEEKTELQAESKKVVTHLTEAQNLIKKLQMTAAEIASVPEVHGKRAAQIMMKIDKVHLAIEPDSGAPSAKRCCACLLVATLSPFCPATGGRHDESGSYPEPIVAPIAPSSPKHSVGGKTGKKRVKEPPSLKTDYPLLCIVLSACVAHWSSGVPCECGNTVMNKPPPPPLTPNRRKTKSLLKHISGSLLPDIRSKKKKVGSWSGGEKPHPLRAFLSEYVESLVSYGKEKPSLRQAPFPENSDTQGLVAGFEKAVLELLKHMNDLPDVPTIDFSPMPPSRSRSTGSEMVVPHLPEHKQLKKKRGSKTKK